SVRHRATKPRSPPACNAKVASSGCLMVLPLPSFDIPAELGAPVGDVRTNGGLGAIELLRDLLGGESFDIAQHEGGAFPGAEEAEAVFQVIPLFGPEENLLGVLGLRVAFRGVIDVAKGGASVAAEKVDGGIRGDSRQPMSCFLLFLELFLVL